MGSFFGKFSVEFDGVGDSGPRTLDNFLTDGIPHGVDFFLDGHNSILATYSASCLLIASSLISFLVILGLVVLYTSEQQSSGDLLRYRVAVGDSPTLFLLGFLLGH